MIAACGRIVAGSAACGRIVAGFAAFGRIVTGFAAFGRINRSNIQFSKQRTRPSEFRSRFVFKAGMAVGVHGLSPQGGLVKEQGDDRLASSDCGG